MIPNQKVINIHFVIQHDDPTKCDCDYCVMVLGLVDGLKALYSEHEPTFEFTVLSDYHPEDAMRLLYDLADEGMPLMFIRDIDEATIELGTDFFVMTYDNGAKAVNYIVSDLVIERGDVPPIEIDPMFQ